MHLYILQIDEHVFLLMSTDEIKKYIPTYGDQLAATAFCKKLGITTVVQEEKNTCRSCKYFRKTENQNVQKEVERHR